MTCASLGGYHPPKLECKCGNIAHNRIALGPTRLRYLFAPLMSEALGFAHTQEERRKKRY